MKQRKSIVALSVIVLVSITIICLGAAVFMSRKDDKYVKIAEENDISRYEWTKMLCEQTGLTEYQKEEPYYEDVNADNAYFPYIQSAVEWDVLPGEDKFEGDGYASGRFVAVTAMRTLGERKLMAYLETEDTLSDDTYLELAMEYGLIEKEKLAEGVSAAECVHILESLQGLSFGAFWKNDYSHIVYQDGVTELSPEEVLRSDVSGMKIVVSDSARGKLETGTVIAYEEKNTKLKYVRKIVKADADGTVELSPVALEQAVESFTVSDITEVTFEDIVNGYASDENVYSFHHLDDWQGDARLMDMRVFAGEKQHNGFKITLSTKDDDDEKYLEVAISDRGSGNSVSLPIGDTVKLEGDYSAELDIDKILIGAQADFTALKGGLQYADVAVDIHSTFKGEVKTEEEVKLPLYKSPVPIPLAGGIVGVDLQLYLVISVGGTISIEAELPMGASVIYEKDKGLRNQKHELETGNPTLEANCDANMMLRFEPILVAFEKNLIDMEVDVGATASAKITTQSNSQICAETAISFPVITLSVGGDDDANTLVNDLELSAEWEVFTSKNAPIHINTHFEALPDGTAQFVDACTYQKGKEEVTREKDDTANVQLSNTYYTRYKEITGIDRPTFCFDYPDGWEITREEVVEDHEDDTYMQYYGEIVELTSERGARVTYTQYKMEPSAVGNGSVFDYVLEYEVEKIGESGLSLSRESDSAELMVARIKELGGISYADSYRTGEVVGESINSDGVSYALLLNDKEGAQTAYGYPEYYGMCSFYYPKADSFNPYTFIAESADGHFTDEEEEKEVIAILSSFREVQ